MKVKAALASISSQGGDWDCKKDSSVWVPSFCGKTISVKGTDGHATGQPVTMTIADCSMPEGDVGKFDFRNDLTKHAIW